MITSALWVLPATGAIARFIPLPVAERSRRLAGGRAKEPQIGASYVALACVSSGTQIRSYGAACCNVMLAVEGVANGEDKTILVGNGHVPAAAAGWSLDSSAIHYHPGQRAGC